MSEVTAYVTLENGSFVGRTPACAITLVKLGIKNAVASIQDRDPRNIGKGIQILESRGVTVKVGL
ncbi:hypothetical protein [Shewanella sediminis]|nr:hypothetical protein [Shewanella sediminis]